MAARTSEDLLREEYFDLLPDIRRLLLYLEAEVRYHTRKVLRTHKTYEQLVIKLRVKECESAVKSLRRRQEGGTFDPEKSGPNSVLRLPDWAGVRVLVFPRGRVDEVDSALREPFAEWLSDPVLDGKGTILAYKYAGRCTEVNVAMSAEYQVVPMLIGLYSEVEHPAIYKPAPSIKAPKDKMNSGPMEKLDATVTEALLRFEAEFERLKLDQSESS
jgi:hypothetical protein